MKAKLSQRKESFNINHRKGSLPGLDRVYKVIEKSTMAEVVDCRIYWSSTFATCYCCLWVHRNNTYASGSGKAGGYGYHKQSAAVSDAIYNAGFDLGKYTAGGGDDAIEEALIAVARTATRKQVHLIKCHA